MPNALELNVTTTTDATTIANSIFGEGIQVVSATLTGAATQAGTYTGGETTSGGVVPSDSGVILSTGDATDFTTAGAGTNTNTSAGTSTNQGGAGDADLDAISSTSTFDAVVFESTFIPDDDFITMQFVFSSEEYLEYVNSGVNDTLGVWVNGSFVPLTSSGDTVSIDTVNNASNSNLYVDNPAGADTFNTEMDGFTLTLSFKAQVNPGVNNTIKIGLADGGDSAYDTNVLIAADSIQTVALAFEDFVTLEANSVNIIDVLENDRDTEGNGMRLTEINGQAVVPGDSVTLNTGEVVTLNDDYTLTVATDGDLGETVFTYTVENASGNTDVGFVNIQTVANAPLDGIVEGSGLSEMIDGSYTGDAEGDMVDANDAIGVNGTTGDDDYILAYGGDDTINSGAGDDIVDGGTGDDQITAGSGDDTIILSDGFGNDTILGGETGETDGDVLDMSAVTSGVELDLTDADPEAGRVFEAGTSGGATQFSEIENIILSGGRDTVHLGDGGGLDAVSGFDISDSGDGTANDQLDVSNLTSDGGTTPVTTADVTVGSDPYGNAVLTFPGGEAITLQGVNPLDLSTVDDLVAIGIPDGRDYVVEGTSGNDTINAGYTGDPEGDLVDANDNAAGTNDDSIVAGAGADIISGGLGADTMEGGTGSDAFILDTNFGDDVIVGGENAGDADAISATGVADDLTVSFSGEEAGTITGAGDTVTFSEIEVIETGSGADSIDASATTDGVDLATGAGADTVQGGSGDDTIKLGNSSPDGDADVVVLEDGFGDDVIGYFDAPTDNGNGTWTGIDTLDVTAMTDGAGNPLDTNDVVVTDTNGDGSGTPILTFPGGDSVTLDIGLTAAELSDPAVLNAIGIPYPPSATIHDAILIDFVPTSTDTLTTGSEMFVVEEPLVFTTAGSGSLAVGDTIDLGGTIYTVTGLHDYTADLTSNDGALTEPVSGNIIALSDGAGGTLNYMIVDDSLGDRTDITQADMTTVNPATGAIPVVDIDSNDDVTLSGLNFVVEGGGGNDTIDAGYTGDPQGDMVDAGDAADGSNDDVIEAGGGDDSVVAGAGNDSVQADTGNDTVEGGAGDDTIRGATGNDSLDGGAGADSLFGDEGNDTLIGDAGDDTIDGGLGADSIDGGDDNDSISGNDGDDTIHGGAGDDWLRGSVGNDEMWGGTGDDYIWSGFNDDTIRVENDFGNDTIEAEGVDEVNGDVLDLSLVTDDLTIDLSNVNPEIGTFTDGVSTAQFNEIENIVLGGGRDTIILADGSGADFVQAFDLTDSGDGSTNDQLDVSGLTSDGGTTPVTTADVTVTDDGSGNAVLTFPGGESITLIGVAPGDVDSAAELVAIGIPDGRDYIVEGTSGSDTIDAGYTGDPELDFIDNNDHSDGSNDDSVLADAGDDSVVAGLGDDTVFGQDGADTILGGAGNDSLDGDDVLATGGADSIDGGAGNDTIIGDSFDDTLIGGSGDDSIFAGADDDLVYGGTGDDQVFGEGGDDTVIVEDFFGNDNLYGGETAETDGDTLDLSNLTVDTTIDLSSVNPEKVTITDGVDTVNAEEFENLILGGGEDTLLLGDGGGSDLVAGFDMGDRGDGHTFDQLDVSGVTSDGITPVTAWDVVVTDTNGDGSGDAILTFPGGESITLEGVAPTQVDTIPELFAIGIPCFTPGAMIITADGERPVEDIRPGDMVLTADNGFQPVRWVGRRTLGAQELAENPNLKPVVIRKGAFGNARKMIVSPQHGFVMKTDTGERLIRAKHAADLFGGQIARLDKDCEDVTYVHIMFEQHEIVFAEGALTEAFYPGPQALKSIDRAAMAELLTLFPELAHVAYGEDGCADRYGPPARDYLLGRDIRAMKKAVLDGCSETSGLA
jgi:Ca2+-binding RTX toxin-like protein